MRTIVEVEDFKFGHFEREGTEKPYARIGGRDAKGRWLSAVAFDAKAEALNREMENLTPEGQDISAMRLAVELTGEFRDGKPRRRADGTQVRSRSFFVASYHVLTGPALELTRLRRDAVDVMSRAADAAASNDHRAAYEALHGFIARMTGRPAPAEEVADDLEASAQASKPAETDAVAAPEAEVQEADVAEEKTVEADASAPETVADSAPAADRSAEDKAAVSTPADAEPAPAEGAEAASEAKAEASSPADGVPPAENAEAEAAPAVQDEAAPATEDVASKSEAPADSKPSPQAPQPATKLQGFGRPLPGNRPQPGISRVAPARPIAAPTAVPGGAPAGAPAGAKPASPRPAGLSALAARNPDPEAAAAAHYARKDAAGGAKANDILDDAPSDTNTLAANVEPPAATPRAAPKVPAFLASSRSSSPAASSTKAAPAQAAPKPARPIAGMGLPTRPTFGAFRR